MRKDGEGLKFKFFCAAALCLLLIVPVSAAQPEYTFRPPDGFIFADASDDKTKLADALGLTADELNRLYDKQNILFAAVSSDRTTQLRLLKTANAFSERCVSFSRLSDTELNELAPQLAGTLFNNGGIVKGNDGTKYVRLTQSLHDSGGDYTVTEYLTVCNSTLYTFSVTADDTVTGADTEAAFKSLTLRDAEKSSVGTGHTLYAVLAAAGIAVFTAAAAICLFLILRDFKQKRNQTDD